MYDAQLDIRTKAPKAAIDSDVTCRRKTELEISRNSKSLEICTEHKVWENSSYGKEENTENGVRHCITHGVYKAFFVFELLLYLRV